MQRPVALSLATTTCSSPRRNMNLVPAIFTPVEEKLGHPEATAVISYTIKFIDNIQLLVMVEGIRSMDLVEGHNYCKKS